MYAEIPLASPYSVTPGAVPASLLAGQFAVNLPDRRVFAGGEDGLPRVIYDPVAPQIINLGNGQPGITLQSGNATGGMSDTVPALRLAGSSAAGDGWDWRYLTNGDLQQVRRVGGVETVALEMRRTGAITLGGVFGTGFMVQTAATNPNGLRLLTGSSGTDPQFQVFSPDTDRGMRVLLKGAAGFSVAQNGTGRSVFTATAPANLANGVLMTGGATGWPVVLAGVGADSNVPVQIMSQGTGDLRFGCGYPSWSPSLLLAGRLGNTDYLSVTGGDSTSPVTLAAVSTTNADATLRLIGQGIGGVRIDGAVGFGVAPIARQTITGSRSDGSALAALLSALQARGDITDGTTT